MLRHLVAFNSALVASKCHVNASQSGHSEGLTLLFCPDQWTIAWLWEESPDRAKIVLLSLSSSCLGGADLRSSPLQRSSERLTLRPAPEPTSSSAGVPLGRLVKPAFATFTPLNSCGFSVFRVCVLNPGAHSSSAQRTLGAGVPALPLRPKTSAVKSNLTSNSFGCHLCPDWHDLQVISALAARIKPNAIRRENQSALCHFGLNLTLLSMSGHRDTGKKKTLCV